MVQTKASTQVHFQIRPDSPLSPEQQLIAQLKLAIMLGELKPGQTLPSVRELEALTGVGRNIIWRAYSKLAELGALTLRRRRRAVVSPNDDPSKASELVAVYEWLARDFLERLRALRVNPQSFLRYLDHKLQASDAIQRDTGFVECCNVFAERWSKEISELWEVLVPGYNLQTVREIGLDERARFKTVLVPLQHYEEVLELFQNGYTQVVPLKIVWDEEIIQALQDLPEGSPMAIVFAASAYSDPWVRELQSLCPNLRIEVVTFESRQQIKQVVDSGKYRRIHVSGSVIDAVYDEVRHCPIFVQQLLKVDRRSLEEARIRAGVVL